MLVSDLIGPNPCLECHEDTKCGCSIDGYIVLRPSCLPGAVYTSKNSMLGKLITEGEKIYGTHPKGWLVWIDKDQDED